MKSRVLYLVAALCFFVAAIIYFLFMEDNRVAFGSAFAALGCAFVAVYVRSRKKAGS